MPMVSAQSNAPEKRVSVRIPAGLYVALLLTSRALFFHHNPVEWVPTWWAGGKVCL